MFSKDSVLYNWGTIRLVLVSVSWKELNSLLIQLILTAFYNVEKIEQYFSVPADWEAEYTLEQAKNLMKEADIV